MEQIRSGETVRFSAT